MGFSGFNRHLIECIDVLDEFAAVRSQRADSFFGFTVVAPGLVEDTFEDWENTFKAVDAVPTNIEVWDVFAGLVVFESIPMVASDGSVFHARPLFCRDLGQRREQF